MKKMSTKNYLMITLAVILGLLFITGCGGGGSSSPANGEGGNGMTGTIALSMTKSLFPEQIITGEIWLINKTGSSLLAEDCHPYGSLIKISPDGTKVAYRDSKNNFIIMAANKSKKTTYADIYGESRWQWSRDSQGVLIASSSLSQFGLDFAKMNIVTTGASSIIENASQSRDGATTYIAEQLTNNGVKQKVFRKIATSKLLQGRLVLTDCEEILRFDAYEAGGSLETTDTGKLLYFWAQGIELIDPIAKTRKSFPLILMNYARMSPNGKKVGILQGSYFKLRFFDANTLTETNINESQYFAPMNGTLSSFAWSPDSSALAISVNNNVSYNASAWIYNFKDRSTKLIFSRGTSRDYGDGYGDSHKTMSISWSEK
jgi:hypothetical protein